MSEEKRGIEDYFRKQQYKLFLLKTKHTDKIIQAGEKNLTISDYKEMLEEQVKLRQELKDEHRNMLQEALRSYSASSPQPNKKQPIKKLRFIKYFRNSDR